jgi:hypothetical protein
LRTLFALALFLALGIHQVAEAMCFCMVRPPPPPDFVRRGLETRLLSDASSVILMREGRRTVLTTRGDYRGAPEDFALVVPVPEVLEQEQVRTINPILFDRFARLSAPKLEEYWEQDPCPQPIAGVGGGLAAPSARPSSEAAGDGEDGRGRGAGYLEPPPPPVEVERHYTVAEYDINVLSASDSTGLVTWLREHGYNLPDGAEPVLRPYVERGTKFFVAKVDADRLRFEGGRAQLDPLQFYYDADEFELPIRLGLLNSDGTQDLVVYTMTRARRVEVANYENATIPTNLRVNETVRDSFPAFFAGLYDRVVGGRDRIVVTEFAKTLDDDDLSSEDLQNAGAISTPSRSLQGFTLTRLHFRYTKDTLGDDLTFRYADAIGAGAESITPDGSLGPRRAERRTLNDFRARYVILHPWEGSRSCGSPRNGRWGHRPGARAPAQVRPDPYTAPLATSAVEAAITGGIADLGFPSPQAAQPTVQQPATETPIAVPIATPPPPDADDGLCSTAGVDRFGWISIALVVFVWLRKRAVSARATSPRAPGSRRRCRRR